jgi:chemotaxis-related protein WspB
MLYVVFRLGGERYALDVRHVAEVLPLVDVRPVPGAPSGIAGVFLYRGSPVPVIDMAEIIAGRPSERRSSTRLVVVNAPEACAPGRHVALMAERATETISRNPDDFAPPVVASVSTPALGKVAIDALGMIQQIDPEVLITQTVRDGLFQELGA